MKRNSNVLTANLGSLFPVLATMSSKAVSTAKPVAPREAPPMPLDYKTHGQFKKHMHFCVAGNHHWTVFVTVPMCPYRKVDPKTGVPTICPINVACSSHATVGDLQQ